MSWREFAVLKLDGADGRELWREEIDATNPPSGDVAAGVAVLPSGDVVAAGSIESSNDPTSTLVRFSGSNGAETCRTTLKVEPPSGFSNQSSKAAM